MSEKVVKGHVHSGEIPFALRGDLKSSCCVYSDYKTSDIRILSMSQRIVNFLSARWFLSLTLCTTETLLYLIHVDGR